MYSYVTKDAPLKPKCEHENVNTARQHATRLSSGQVGHPHPAGKKYCQTPNVE